MGHNHQSGASAEALAAENIIYARTITRLAALLRDIATSEPRFKDDIELALWRERDPLNRAAAVWPPVERGE